MPRVIGKCARVHEGDGAFFVDELVGLVATRSEALSVADICIAKTILPRDKYCSWMIRDFDNWTCVERGRIEIQGQNESGDACAVEVKAGESSFKCKGCNFKFVFPETGTEYFSVSVPAWHPNKFKITGMEASGLVGTPRSIRRSVQIKDSSMTVDEFIGMLASEEETVSISIFKVARAAKWKKTIARYKFESDTWICVRKGRLAFQYETNQGVEAYVEVKAGQTCFLAEGELCWPFCKVPGTEWLAISIPATPPVSLVEYYGLLLGKG